MIKAEINIEKPMPYWAENYLNSNELYVAIRILKKTKRYMSLPILLNGMDKAEALDTIYCNTKGNVVFKWNTAQEKTAFLLKWS